MKPLPAIIKDLISLQTLSDIDRTVVFRVGRTVPTYLCNVLIDSSQSQQSMPILPEKERVYLYRHPANLYTHRTSMLLVHETKAHQNLNKVWAVLGRTDAAG